MKQIDVEIKFKEGLHARPAVKLIKLVSKLESTVTIEKDGAKYAANSITAILSAGMMCGDKISLRAEGTDEDIAITQLTEYFTL